LEEPRVKVNYDPHTDTLTFILKEKVAVAESDEDKPGVVLDYDGEGNLVSMEILDASRRVTEARRVDFRIAG
jgi:YD repeat-containing protein